MTDTITIAEVNALFDSIWEDRNELVNALPWIYREQVSNQATRERALSLAYKYVAKVDAARATATAELAKAHPATPLPPNTDPKP